MKNNPTAITVPNTTKKFWADNLKLRNPTISVKIATTNAAEVSIVPVLIALALASAEKSAIVSFPSETKFANSSR